MVVIGSDFDPRKNTNHVTIQRQHMMSTLLFTAIADNAIIYVIENPYPPSDTSSFDSPFPVDLYLIILLLPPLPRLANSAFIRLLRPCTCFTHVVETTGVVLPINRPIHFSYLHHR